MLKAVFFDAAGTLFEPREPVGLSYARIAHDHGVKAGADEVSASFRSAFHNAGGLAFGPGHAADELRTLEREWWRRLVAETFAKLGRFSDFDAYFNELFGYFADPAHWRADADAASTLASLRERGLTVGIISNFDHRLYAILEGLGLAGYFDSITISSEAGYAKPSAKVFQAALGRHSLTPAQALHVGDSEHLDLAGAAGAGLAAVLIDHKLPVPTSLTGRTARIARLANVPQLLREIPFP